MWRILTALAASLAIVSYARAAFGFDLGGQPAFLSSAYETIRNVALFFFPAENFVDIENARWSWLGLNEAEQLKDGAAYLAMLGGSYLRPLGQSSGDRLKALNVFRDAGFLRSTGYFIGISAAAAVALIAWGTIGAAPTTSP